MKKTDIEVMRFNDASSGVAGWVYDKDNVADARMKLLDSMNSYGLYGEMRHDGRTPSVDVIIEYVSHAVTNVKIKENSMYIDIETLETTKGKHLASLLDMVKFVPRMVGTVNEDKTVDIDRIFTFDAFPADVIRTSFDFDAWLQSLNRQFNRAEIKS